MSGLGKHSWCVKLYRWSVFLPPVTSSGAALLLQPFVQDHFANQQHTTRCKCTGKSKLPPFSALRPCKLIPSPPALPWKTVFQPSVRLTWRICKPYCKIGCCRDRLSTEGISLWLSTLSPCAHRGICQMEAEGYLCEVWSFLWDCGSIKSWSSSVVVLVVHLSRKEIAWCRE